MTNLNTTKLRVKRKTLAAETRIIRDEERKAARQGDEFRLSILRSHRVTVVRRVARAAHLAHAYLKGMPYRAVEDPKTTRSEPDAVEIAKNLRTFGGNAERDATRKDVLFWLDGGQTLQQEQASAAA